MQNPGDYLVHEHVFDEAPEAALRAVGLDGPAFAQRHPRELSGGEKQRLALAVVLGDPGNPGDPSDGDRRRVEPTAVLCLDEPTRGMDRDHKRSLATLLEGIDGAVLVATHDTEFAASFAQRVLLLADGRLIGDGPARQMLSGGSYFVTETARILGGAAGALTPEQGILALTAATEQPVGVNV
jgi:energy-coupling factor transporter ATP-binding protein EcfA2